MKLTGEAKEQFEKWYNLEYNYNNRGWRLEEFYNLPEPMQWGVYQDWADSLGYDVVVEPSENYNVFWYTLYDPDKNMNNKSGYTNRQEARNAAIEKLNEIINEK